MNTCSFQYSPPTSDIDGGISRFLDLLQYRRQPSYDELTISKSILLFKFVNTDRARAPTEIHKCTLILLVKGMHKH